MADEKTLRAEEFELGFTEKDDSVYRAGLDVVAGPKPQLELKAKFAEEAHHYISECIRVADQKAAFLFAAGTTVLTFLYHEGSRPFLRDVSTWNPRGL